MLMMKNRAPFFWRPIHEKCFQMIKTICCKTLVIKPVDYKSEEPVWVICDVSKTGVGAMYGQGKDWTTCRLAGFMSKKFTSAQQHYAVHEMETLTILEALQKWEDKLIGKRIHVITATRHSNSLKHNHGCQIDNNAGQIICWNSILT